MRRLRRTFFLAIALVVIAAAVDAGLGSAARLFTLDEDGTTFLYRALPGETPGAVASMFGLSQRDLAGFLAANGISDATRVGAGFVYRIPNVAARALSERLAALEADNARLTHESAAAAARSDQLAREVEEARAVAADAEAHANRAARLETLWPILQVMLILLVLGTGAAIGIASAAVSRQRRAERYARSLAVELEEKRKAALADRQESARRILELEGRTRALEAQIGPRLLVGGRSS